MMNSYKKALRAAFPHTIPILISFLLVGLAYGIFAASKGLPFWVPMLTCLVIFAGSMEFVTVNLLLGAFNPLAAFFMAVVVNARHFFYSISMVESFRNIGKKKWYMIFAMCDESFLVYNAVKPPEDIDRGQFMMAVTMWNQLYWVTGASLGGLLGTVLRFNSRGIDFILVALYVTLFLDQWMSTKQHIPALTGVIASVGCVIALGADNFMLPALLLVLVTLLLLKNKLQARKQEEERV